MSNPDPTEWTSNGLDWSKRGIPLVDALRAIQAAYNERWKAAGEPATTNGPAFRALDFTDGHVITLSNDISPMGQAIIELFQYFWDTDTFAEGATGETGLSPNPTFLVGPTVWTTARIAAHRGIAHIDTDANTVNPPLYISYDILLQYYDYLNLLTLVKIDEDIAAGDLTRKKKFGEGDTYALAVTDYNANTPTLIGAKGLGKTVRSTAQWDYIDVPMFFDESVALTRISKEVYADTLSAPQVDQKSTLLVGSVPIPSYTGGGGAEDPSTIAVFDDHGNASIANGEFHIYYTEDPPSQLTSRNSTHLIADALFNTAPDDPTGTPPPFPGEDEEWLSNVLGEGNIAGSATTSPERYSFIALALDFNVTDGYNFKI